MKILQELRENYKKNVLLEADVPESPFLLFQEWMRLAINAKVKEPNAMTLATVDEKGFPDARIVLLKEIIDEEFVFYTNYNSSKAQHVESNPRVSLVFLWKDMERQIKIRGTATKVSRDVTTHYFNSRPRSSQLGAWVSPQSEKLESREQLDKMEAGVTDRFADIETIPVPDHWGGYGISPYEIEFWQGRTSRLHDRLVYTKEGKSWNLIRKAP